MTWDILEYTPLPPSQIKTPLFYFGLFQIKTELFFSGHSQPTKFHNTQQVLFFTTDWDGGSNKQCPYDPSEVHA